MKAIVIHQHGGPEVMRWEDVPDPPPPGPAQVRMRIKAAGVNFADHLTRIGAYPNSDPPVTPGIEAAGVVEAVGPDVQGLRPGQPVLSWGRATYAELANTDAKLVRPMPDGLSFEQAAAIPVVFGTAWHGLAVHAHLEPGERVLIHAAGSGVGSAAIQVAKALGAWVFATAGQDWKLERARELGADAVANYSTQDIAAEIKQATNGEGIDVALEGVGKATFPATLTSMAYKGRVVIYGAPSGPRVELDTRLAIFRNLTLYGISVSTDVNFPESIESFSQTALPWFSEGHLQPVIDRVYPIQEAGAAHQRLIDRAQFGKLVLKVAD